MNLATWSIRNPIPVVLLFLLVSLAGVWGFMHLGIQDFPDIELPGVNVSLKLPGAAPAQLETEVAKKVEDKLAGLRGVRPLNTTISDGDVSISVNFEIGTSLTDALLDVKDAIDSVKFDLPADVTTPQVTKVTIGSGSPTMIFAITHPSMSEEELSWIADSVIARSMLSVSGVGRFSRLGGVQREIQVWLQPTKLNALGVTAVDVSRALKRVQQDNSGGRGQIDGAEQGVRTIASVHTVEDLRQLPVTLSDGRMFKLNQVAEVRDTVAERAQAAMLDGASAIGFSVSRNKGVNELELEAGVLDRIKTLENSYPGLKFQKISSVVDSTREQYKGSMSLMLEGALLAVIVIWLYLRDWRATVIGAAALPLSIFPTFAFMYWANYPLNTITLLALAVVVGVLVDDAIVEVENIERHARMGKSVQQSTEDAVNEIWMAVLATTAALVVVFLPTAYMSGPPGLVFRQFGWTVVFSVVASLVVARLVTPLMAVWLLRPHDHVESPDGPIMTRYLSVVKWCLTNRLKAFLIGTMLFLASLGLIPFLKTGFQPAGDKSSSVISIELPPGTPLKTTMATAEEARQAIKNITGVRTVFVTAGSSQVAGGPRSQAGEVRKASINVLFEERGARPTQQVIENAMRSSMQSIPGVRWSIGGGGSGEKLQLILTSQDPEALKQSALSLERQMRELSFLSGVTSSISTERPEFTVRPDSERAAERGVTAQSIGETLRVATSGDATASLAKLNLDQRQLDIVVRLPDEVRTDVEALSSLRIPGKDGLVPLNSVATISMESGPAQITRYARSRNVAISADLGGYPLSAAMRDVRALPALQSLPESVKLVESGDANIMTDMFNGFGIALLVGVLGKYSVLVLLYKNWYQPLTNLSALPLSVGGALLGLLLFDGTLSLPALIGIVMLFGVVSKNSILIVDYAFIAMRSKGLSEKDALLDACHKRARPVMMTTVAMVIGMAPLVLGYGGDASFRQPMAIAVTGGLIVSTALSLILVPVVSTYVTSLESFVSRIPPRILSLVKFKKFKD